MRKVLVPFLALVLAGLACSTSGIQNSLEAATETNEVKFLSPTVNTRVVEAYTPGQPMYLPLIIDYQSSVPEVKQARVWVNGLGPIICPLTPGTQTNCGDFPMFAPGPQSIKVEIDKMRGEVKSYSVDFIWKEYAGVEKVADTLSRNIFNSTDITDGYLLMTGVLIVLVVIILMIVTKGSIVGAGIGAFVSMILLALAFAMLGGNQAITVIWYLVSGMILLAVLGVILQAVKKGYTARGGKTAEIDVSVGDFKARGRLSDGARVGPGDSDDMNNSEQKLFSRLLQSMPKETKKKYLPSGYEEVVNAEVREIK